MSKKRKSIYPVKPLRFWMGVALLIPVIYLYVAIHTQQYGAFVVVSRSMSPTLKVRDFVLVDKTYQYQARRLDVITFHSPDDYEEVLVKRVIGIPGDVIEVIKGSVFVNGEEETPQEFNQLLRGINYYRCEVEGGEVFVLGDNRNLSYDSLDFGPVPYRLIVGKVLFCYWPLRRIAFVS